MSFGPQQLPFQLQVAPESAQEASCADDPMARRRRIATFAKNTADGPVRAGGPGESRDVAVRRHPSHRNTADRREDAAGELGRGRHDATGR